MAHPITPIGRIRSPFTTSAGTPIQPEMAAGSEGIVEVEHELVPGLVDLDGFERIWLIYLFDRAPSACLTVTPFLDSSEHGVFATRAPCRPNPVGMSCVELVKIQGNRLYVKDVDVLDGTPVLDIKPYVPRFDSFPVKRCGWIDTAERKEEKNVVADNRFRSTSDA